MRSNRLAGHTLPNEGRLWDPLWDNGFPVCCGPAICSCGAESKWLHGATARKRWHRQHKDEIRAAAGDPS